MEINLNEFIISAINEYAAILYNQQFKYDDQINMEIDRFL